MTIRARLYRTVEPLTALAERQAREDALAVNAEFIAAARTLVPELVERLEAYERAVGEIRVAAMVAYRKSNTFMFASDINAILDGLDVIGPLPEPIDSGDMGEHPGRWVSLTRETKYLEDGYGGMMIHPDGSSTSVSKPSTRVTRYVSDWETDTVGPLTLPYLKWPNERHTT